MSTERLTPDQALRKWCAITYPNLSGGSKASLQHAVIQYANNEVEQQTKQLREEVQNLKYCITLTETSRDFNKDRADNLKEERDRAVELIVRLHQVLNKSGFAIYPSSPFSKWVEDFLNKLNQQNEH